MVAITRSSQLLRAHRISTNKERLLSRKKESTPCLPFVLTVESGDIVFSEDRNLFGKKRNVCDKNRYADEDLHMTDCKVWAGGKPKQQCDSQQDEGISCFFV